MPRYSKSFKQLPRYIRRRTFKHFNQDVFIQKLAEKNIDQILECSDPNKAVCILNEKLKDILDRLAPIRSIQVRSNYVPGLSDQTKTLQTERNLAQQKA